MQAERLLARGPGGPEVTHWRDVRGWPRSLDREAGFAPPVERVVSHRVSRAMRCSRAAPFASLERGDSRTSKLLLRIAPRAAGCPMTRG